MILPFSKLKARAAFALCAFSIGSPGLVASEISASYVVEQTGDDAAIHLKLSAGGIYESFHVADCSKVWPDVTSLNVFLPDLECDGATVSASIADQGISIAVGAATERVLLLQPGPHIINGIPAQILGDVAVQ